MIEVTGILGGLGPQTTAEFYIHYVEAATVKNRPAVSIWSLPLDPRKEQEYIASGKHKRYYFSLLHDGANRLVRAGSQLIVIPCNTVHEFHAQLAQKIEVPVTNLIQVVAQEVQRRRWGRAVLLATSRTLQTRLYQNQLKGTGVDLVVPSADDQAKLDLLIQGLLGNQEESDHQGFLERIVSEAGTNNIILGCTDLQLLFAASDCVIDSMDALVQHTTRIMGQ